MLLRAVVGFSLLFFLPILLIRAQTYTATPLELMLSLPDGCESPCFMGVQPWRTDLPTIIALLEAHEAVRNVEIRETRGRLNVIWDWVDFPQWRKNYGFVVDNGTLDWLILPRSITLGEVILALGQPAHAAMTINSSDQRRGAYLLEYPSRAIYIFVGFNACYTDRGRFWRIRADGRLSGSFFVGIGSPDYLVSPAHEWFELDPRIWARQIETTC
jgi:hypothetical protein